MEGGQAKKRVEVISILIHRHHCATKTIFFRDCFHAANAIQFMIEYFFCQNQEALQKKPITIPDHILDQLGNKLSIMELNFHKKNN